MKMHTVRVASSIYMVLAALVHLEYGITQRSVVTSFSGRSLVCLVSSQYQEVRRYMRWLGGAWDESLAAEILEARLVISTHVVGSLDCSCITSQRSARWGLSPSLAETSLLPGYTLWHSSKDSVNCACLSAQSLQTSTNFPCLRETFGVILPRIFYLFLGTGDLLSCEHALLFPDFVYQGSWRECVAAEGMLPAACL